MDVARFDGARALFKQWPALFACNYRVGDLTLATLHLYSAVAPSVTLRSASRFASRFVAVLCIPAIRCVCYINSTANS